MFPCLLFAIISVWPGAVIWGFSIWIYTSIVLCAATVSDGLFLTVYALLMFIMMAAFFDSFRKGVDPGVIALPGLYVSHSLPLVLLTPLSLLLIAFYRFYSHSSSHMLKVLFDSSILLDSLKDGFCGLIFFDL